MFAVNGSYSIEKVPMLAKLCIEMTIVFNEMMQIIQWIGFTPGHYIISIIPLETIFIS